MPQFIVFTGGRKFNLGGKILNLGGQIFKLGGRIFNLGGRISALMKNYNFVFFREIGDLVIERVPLQSPSGMAINSKGLFTETRLKEMGVTSP